MCQAQKEILYSAQSTSYYLFFDDYNHEMTVKKGAATHGKS